jgi:hypothetical protein
MTQYTKYTKNLGYSYDENLQKNLNSSPTATTNIHMTAHNHHFGSKSPSRGSNMTSLNAGGSPALSINSSLPKPVLITNLNSSNIGNLIKNERIKSSALARSVTMRYNTNTKSQFENGNFANGLMQPVIK